jgi:hypothetical protein
VFGVIELFSAVDVTANASSKLQSIIFDLTLLEKLVKECHGNSVIGLF